MNAVEALKVSTPGGTIVAVPHPAGEYPNIEVSINDLCHALIEWHEPDQTFKIWVFDKDNDDPVYMLDLNQPTPEVPGFLP